MSDIKTNTQIVVINGMRWARKLYGIIFLSILAFSIHIFLRSTDDKLEIHNVIGCSVYDMKGELIWHVPYSPCIFFEDGHVLAADTDSIKMLNQKLELVWQKKIPVHHQIKQQDGEILLISERYGSYKGRLVRFDALYVINKSGDIQKSFYLDERISTWNRWDEDDLWEIESSDQKNPNVKYEFSHFNSFYRIPANAVASKIPAFEEGNYIANDNYSGQFFILDKDLKNILWSAKHRRIFGGHSVHDVQVLPSGKILFYGNRTEERLFSALDEFDPLTGTQKHLFVASPPESFYSKYSGGVQILANGNFLYSDITKGPWAYEVNPNKNWERVWSMKKDIPSHQEQSFQQIKRYDLFQFLKKNKGL